MKNQEKIFVIGHKNPDTIPSVRQLPMRHQKQNYAERNIFRSVQDRSMKRQNMC